MTTIPLEPVDSITITTLMDNVTDMLAPDQGPARRADVAAAGAPRMPAAFLEGGQALDALRAEHGFSALVTIETAGKPRRLLFDAGPPPHGAGEKNRRPSPSAQGDWER